jgi:hypothetical protein
LLSKRQLDGRAARATSGELFQLLALGGDDVIARLRTLEEQSRKFASVPALIRELQEQATTVKARSSIRKEARASARQAIIGFLGDRSCQLFRGLRKLEVSTGSLDQLVAEGSYLGCLNHLRRLNVEGAVFGSVLELTQAVLKSERDAREQAAQLTAFFLNSQGALFTTLTAVEPSDVRRLLILASGQALSLMRGFEISGRQFRSFLQLMAATATVLKTPAQRTHLQYIVQQRKHIYANTLHEATWQAYLSQQVARRTTSGLANREARRGAPSCAGNCWSDCCISNKTVDKFWIPGIGHARVVLKARKSCLFNSAAMKLSVFFASLALAPGALGGFTLTSFSGPDCEPGTETTVIPTKKNGSTITTNIRLL